MGKYFGCEITILISLVRKMTRRITEQDEDSMSLNENTELIQTYNNLEYSDEYESSHSSQEHSLSGLHRA